MEFFVVTDAKDVITMQVLLKLIFPRGAKKGLLLHCIEVSEIHCKALIWKYFYSLLKLTLIRKFWNWISSSLLFWLLVNLVHKPPNSSFAVNPKFSGSLSLRDSKIDLMSSYFVLDISYPKTISGILIFLQHHVVCLSDQQAVPPAVKTLLTNLQKM